MCVGQSLEPVYLFPIAAVAQAGFSVVIFVAVDSFVSLTDVLVVLCRSTKENCKPCPRGDFTKLVFFDQDKSSKYLFSFYQFPCDRNLSLGVCLELHYSLWGAEGWANMGLMEYKHVNCWNCIYVRQVFLRNGKILLPSAAFAYSWALSGP